MKPILSSVFLAVGTLIALVSILYLYPYSGIDPIDAHPFYTHPSYLSVCVPYAVAFVLLSAFTLLRRSKIAAILLFILFLVSPLHMRSVFPAIEFKSPFVAIFIVLPALLLAFGIRGLHRSK